MHEEREFFYSQKHSGSFDSFDRAPVSPEIAAFPSFAFVKIESSVAKSYPASDRNGAPINSLPVDSFPNQRITSLSKECGDEKLARCASAPIPESA